MAVTQQFNTTNSLGRPDAEHPALLRAVRTRDHRRAHAGQDVGGAEEGQVDRRAPAPWLRHRLRAAGGIRDQPAEAEQAREIFRLYEKERGLIPVVRELNRRGWASSSGPRRKGNERGGKPFTKSALFKMLTNATYLGKIAFQGQMYEGEHEGIVDPALWEAVQRTLKHNGRTGGAEVRNRYGAILKGLIYCLPCNCRHGPHLHIAGNPAAIDTMFARLPSNGDGCMQDEVSLGARHRRRGPRANTERGGESRRCWLPPLHV